MPDGETTAEPGAASTLDDPYEALTRDALLEITPAATVGALSSRVDEGDGVVSLQFLSTMPGYPDWRWTVSVAEVEGEAPTVLEVELMPGTGAVLAPDWIPWSDRLAEYTAAKGETSGDVDSADPDEDDSDEDPEDDDLDDESDDDELDEEDVLGSDLLHGGDLDGVDIDTLDAPDDNETDDHTSDDDTDDYSDDDETDDDERDKSY